MYVSGYLYRYLSIYRYFDVFFVGDCPFFDHLIKKVKNSVRHLSLDVPRGTVHLVSDRILSLRALHEQV